MVEHRSGHVDEQPGVPPAQLGLGSIEQADQHFGQHLVDRRGPKLLDVLADLVLRRAAAGLRLARLGHSHTVASQPPLTERSVGNPKPNRDLEMLVDAVCGLASFSTMIRMVRRSRRFAHAARAAAVLFVAVALAGCMKVDIDLTLDGDTVDGFMIMGVEKEFLDMVEMSPDDVIGGLDADEDIPEGATVEPWEDDSYVGQRVLLDDIAISEYDDPGFVAIDHDADAGRYEVTGQMDMTNFGDAADLEGLPSSMVDAVTGAFDASISITFPGEVIETNGQVSGTTVTWVPAVGETNEIRAVASDGTSGGVPIGLLIGMGAAVLVAITGLVFVLTRRNSAEPDEQQHTAEPAGV